MKGRSSSKQGAKISKVGISMEKHKVDKVKEVPHLSGAYIRSLVKHLTSTKTKDSINGDEKVLENLNTNGQCFSDHNTMQQESSSPPPPPPPVKKQVRRRQHTSKPYQERLLNMAEARKEIVTALKFHRASMKQQEAATNHDLESKQSLRNSDSKRGTPKAYPSTTMLSNNYLDHHNPSLSCPPSLPYYWPISTISPPPLPPPHHENLNITLPNTPLGLNLNIQDFKNLETNLYHNPLSNYSTSSSSSLTSSCSSSSSSTSSSTAILEMAASLPEEVVAHSTTSSGGANTNGGLHHAMDDEEMEEIRSLGEQHQMEWNDTVNLVMSARWLEFLKTIETRPEARNDPHTYDYDEFSPFDQTMEFPPCMDIDEMEGMDVGWLA